MAGTPSVLIGVIDVTHPHDNSSAIRLRKLIGEDRAAKLRPREHPLGLGLAALSKADQGDVLKEVEVRALGELNLIGRTLGELQKSWKPFAKRVAQDLGDASRCESLIFELHTARIICKGVVGKIIWTRYREGEPDLTLKRPRLAVECKLLRSERRRRRDAIAEAADQHRNTSMPLVVSVGVSREMTPQEVADVIEELPSWKAWFLNHRRVAAGVIFSPMEPPMLGSSGEAPTGSLFQFGNVAIVRSRTAEPPLPPSFRFRGEDRRTEVGF